MHLENFPNRLSPTVFFEQANPATCFLLWIVQPAQPERQQISKLATNRNRRFKNFNLTFGRFDDLHDTNISNSEGQL